MNGKNKMHTVTTTTHSSYGTRYSTTDQNLSTKPSSEPNSQAQMTTKGESTAPTTADASPSSNFMSPGMREVWRASFINKRATPSPEIQRNRLELRSQSAQKKEEVISSDIDSSSSIGSIKETQG